jgi:excisionase family DNA binding protein
MNTGVEPTIQRVIESLAEEIRQGLSRPVYFQVMQEPGGKVSIRHIQFITPEQLAELCHVETRTVYSWIEKAQENGLKFYRAPSTRGVLFEINEVMEWIRNTV